MSKPPLKIQGLADGEATALTALARIEPRYLQAYKEQPYWNERIEIIKSRLKTDFAKQVAAYLTGDEISRDSDSPEEKAAWRLAQSMMLQVQPGYREKILTEKSLPSTNAR